MLKVLCSGISTPHSRRYTVNRIWPGDSCIWVLLCFANGCVVQTDRGLQTAGPGDCILKAPGLAEYAATPEHQQEGFVNDWLHLEAAELGELTEHMHLPVNCLISTGNPLFIRTFLNEIRTEQAAHGFLYEEKIDIILRRMLLAIAEEVNRRENLGTGKYREPLQRLRMQIRQTLEKDWTVPAMASRMGLSTGHFAHLYRSQFGISPAADLTALRLEAAGAQLLNSDRTLREIAESCGFPNEYYFSTVFRKNLRMSPGEYRRKSR